jgi:hypothetical protein
MKLTLAASGTAQIAARPLATGVRFPLSTSAIVAGGDGPSRQHALIHVQERAVALLYGECLRA